GQNRLVHPHPCPRPPPGLCGDRTFLDHRCAPQSLEGFAQGLLAGSSVDKPASQGGVAHVHARPGANLGRWPATPSSTTAVSTDQCESLLVNNGLRLADLAKHAGGEEPQGYLASASIGS